MPSLSRYGQGPKRMAAAVVFCLCIPAVAESAENLDPHLRELFDLWDYNSDGIIEGDEYSAGGGAPRHRDANNDGVLTLDEFADYYGQGGESSDHSSSQSETAQSAELPSIIPQGRYSCLHIYYDFLNKRTMFDPAGIILVYEGNAVTWNGLEGSIYYSGDGEITWKGTDFAELNIVDSGLAWKGDDLAIEITIEVNANNTIDYNCYLRT